MDACYQTWLLKRNKSLVVQCLWGSIPQLKHLLFGSLWQLTFLLHYSARLCIDWQVTCIHHCGYSARCKKAAEQLSKCWHLPDCFSERWGPGLRVLSDSPVSVLRHLEGSGFAPGEQSRAKAQLCCAGFRREASMDEKSCQQENLCLGFCRLWADQLSKGEFQCFTYLISQETSKKRENER